MKVKKNTYALFVNLFVTINFYESCLLDLHRFPTSIMVLG